jgi:hypothetical protein
VTGRADAALQVRAQVSELWSGDGDRPQEDTVLGLIGLLLVIWIAFIVIGAVIHALFWLVIVGAILFVATSAFGFLRGRTRS